MIEVGTVLDEKVFYIDRAMLKAYADASGDQNPIHQMKSLPKLLGCQM
jgi:acyl dehydratase